eukprot:TRINITY_DN3097_c0_g1_i1.p1 TRINITY_DN3097_c0_g1~~TRINITY_DN3097_c0_g1_i1.p1  ORF type:complete len:261 (+),score=41.96 TRINITY_DN3097_c0_g1_i1:92-784(+)
MAEDAACPYPQGRVVPPHRHPEWQGTIPAHFVDRESGFSRAPALQNPHFKDGISGISMQGLGGYYTDVLGKQAEDLSQGKRLLPASRARSGEYMWRNSRRACSTPSVFEPDKITGRPPFVPRSGSWVTSDPAKGLPPIYDPQAESSMSGNLARLKLKRMQREKQEVRDAKRMVAGLDAWESEKCNRGSPGLHASASAAFLDTKRSMAATGDFQLGRSASQSSFKFRQQPF